MSGCKNTQGVFRKHDLVEILTERTISMKSPNEIKAEKRKYVMTYCALAYKRVNSLRAERDFVFKNLAKVERKLKRLKSNSSLDKCSLQELDVLNAERDEQLYKLKGVESQLEVAEKVLKGRQEEARGTEGYLRIGKMEDVSVYKKLL